MLVCIQFWCVYLSVSFRRTGVQHTVYSKKYAHGFVVPCIVVVMQSFIINSHEVFIHIHQGCFAGTGAIVRLPQCQWSKPDGYGKISQCITTTKHSKAKTVCIYLGIYCTLKHEMRINYVMYLMTDNIWLSQTVTQRVPVERKVLLWQLYKAHSQSGMTSRWVSYILWTSYGIT